MIVETEEVSPIVDRSQAIRDISWGKKWGHFFLFFFIGLPSWILAGAIFLQMPILINESPERYDIAAYCVVLIQFGNTFGFLCALVHSRAPSMPAKYLVMGTLFLGLFAVIWTATCSHLTANIGGERSIGLYVSSILSGAVGSLSVVTTYPFVTPYGPFFTTGLSAGSGANGFFLAILSAIQGPGTANQLFDLPTYVSILIIPSVAAIICLAYVIYQKVEAFDEYELEDSKPVPDLNTSYFDQIKEPVLGQFYISLMCYLLMGILPYMVAEFHNGPNNDIGTQLMFWASLAGAFFNCIGRLVTLKTYSANLDVVTLFQLLLFGGIIFIGFLNHTDMSPFWGWCVVIAYGVYSGLYSFANTVNYNVIAIKVPLDRMESASRITGIANQLGSMLGSFIAFFLVIYWFE